MSTKNVDQMPPGIPFIIANEFAERFSTPFSPCT